MWASLHLLIEYGLIVVIVLGMFFLLFVPRCKDCGGYEFTSEILVDDRELLHCVRCGRIK